MKWSWRLPTLSHMPGIPGRAGGARRSPGCRSRSSRAASRSVTEMATWLKPVTAIGAVAMVPPRLVVPLSGSSVPNLALCSPVRRPPGAPLPAPCHCSDLRRRDPQTSCRHAGEEHHGRAGSVHGPGPDRAARIRGRRRHGRHGALARGRSTSDRSSTCRRRLCTTSCTAGSPPVPASPWPSRTPGTSRSS